MVGYLLFMLTFAPSSNTTMIKHTFHKSMVCCWMPMCMPMRITRGLKGI